MYRKSACANCTYFRSLKFNFSAECCVEPSKETSEQPPNIIPDFNLGEYSFITHLNEFHKSPFLFLKRIHNIFGKIQKESIVCSDYYKQLLKEKLINKRMSDLYLDFLDKKKQEYLDRYGHPYGIFTDDPTPKNRDNIKKFITLPKDYNEDNS